LFVKKRQVGFTKKTHRLNVEADGWNGGHHFAEFQFVKDCGFASSIQSNHEDAHILLPEEFSEEFANAETHFVYVWSELRGRVEKVWLLRVLQASVARAILTDKWRMVVRQILIG